MKLKNMDQTHFKVWLIDPVEKTIKPRFLDKKTKDFGLDVQRLIGAGHMVPQQIGVIEQSEVIGDVGLCIAADGEAPKGQPGFRFEGFDVEPTSGKALAFGSSAIQGQIRLMGAPVDIVWMETHVVWTDAAETDGPEAE